MMLCGMLGAPFSTTPGSTRCEHLDVLVGRPLNEHKDVFDFCLEIERKEDEEENEKGTDRERRFRATNPKIQLTVGHHSPSPIGILDPVDDRGCAGLRRCIVGHTLLKMVRWCIRLTRLTLICEVIRYRLVQV